MKPALPKSDTHLGTNLLGFAIALAAIFLLRDWGLTPFDLVVSVLGVALLPVLFIEHVCFKRYRETAAALGTKRPFSAKRVAIKLLGLLGVLAVFTVLYVLLPEYQKPYYHYVWPFYALLIPFMLLGAPLYFFWCDTRQNEPEDGYYQLGRAMLFKKVDSKAIARLMRNWLVKAFFLPLMFTYFYESVTNIQNFHVTSKLGFLELFLMIQAIIMFADLLYATLGYVFTLRIFNAHIRSSEPTFFGWFVAIACYYPIWHMLLYPSYFAYDDGLRWQQVIPPGILQYIWGSVILILTAIYALATVCLGIRFSNLTYRGLVTNGPYRFTKHPAYVAKNLTWWLLALPFISNVDVKKAIAMTLALIGVNLLYYFRARTEENHLSNYPEYVEYAEAMNERSIFAPLAKRLPFLRYKKNPSAL